MSSLPVTGSTKFYALIGHPVKQVRTPTVLNAVLNAIREVGVIDIDMPATSEKVWIAIEEAKKKIAA